LFILASFDKAGSLGYHVFAWLTKLFGIGYYLIPVTLILLAYSFLKGIEDAFKKTRLVGSIVFFISGLGLINIAKTNAGGIIGTWIDYPFLKLIDVWGSLAILLALIIASIMIILETHFTIESLMFWKKFTKKVTDDKEKINPNEEAKIEKAINEVKKETVGNEIKRNDDKSKSKQNSKTDDEDAFDFVPSTTFASLKQYNPPPLSLLEKDRGKPENGDIKANANIIKRTLLNFNIEVEMDEISTGPSVTRYALKPAQGVKLSKIVGLNNDLALALAAHPIRIEAPIPGKSLVGIEVPNVAKTTVGLASLLSSPDFQESEKPLLVSLGKDITGRCHFSNLAKAPHMLIAGATGSGKSVSIHTIITSLLYRNSPENLKFIMIDPKRVELTLYNKIPHLQYPVITDPKNAIKILRWAGKEMQRRYDVLEKNSVRDIESYHRNILAPAILKMEKKDTGETILPESLPYLVIVIDELADIMQSYPRELEAAVVKLAQMSRAVGIHLILSTQRPSVNVITGLIKANVPTRVALQVASQVDSRTILDQIGAEKLLGAGDMLYLGAEMAKPVRLQSAFISETEVKDVVKYLANEYKDHVFDIINLDANENQSNVPNMGSFPTMSLSDSDDPDSNEDEYYDAAKQHVMTFGKGSTSYLQRKLGIGYSRAAKLIDLLEERGVLGPANGSKARELLVPKPDNIPPSTENNETQAI
jgi:S-DNA-T family DNA segregation ATPase FtsK/SpoIIIE